MITELEEVAQQHRYEQRVGGRYQVSERVVWKALARNGHNYKPDEMLDGTIIVAFENGPGMIYRIELDRVYVDGLNNRLGKRIVVGNVSAGQIFQRVSD